MSKTKLAITIDSAFISLILFIIAFVWLNRYIKNAILCFFVCNLIVIIAFFIIFKYSLKKHKLQNLKNKDLKLAEKAFDNLKYLDEKTYIKFFEKLMNAKHITSKIYLHENLFFYIETKQKLIEQDFFDANNFYFTQAKQNPLCFVCCEASPEFLKLIECSPIAFELYTAPDLYNLMKDSNIFPFENQTSLSPKKFSLTKYKNKFLSSITQNHFKDFFLSGLSLIVLSIFIPFSKYYLILGSFLLILSIISLFIKNKSVNAKTKSSLNEITKK